MIGAIIKDFKIYLFFQEDCRIFCEGDIINLDGFDGLVGQDCTISFIGLGLVGFIGLIGHNGLVGIFSLVGLGFIGPSCLVGFIGLVGLVSLVFGGFVGLIGFISLIGLVIFGLNGLIGKGIFVNSLRFEIEMKQSQHDLFLRESWLWCVRRVFSSLTGLDSVFGNALQNVTQLFFDRIPQK